MAGIVKNVELFEGDDGWRWRMQGHNGEILASSEAYSSKSEARDTASLVAVQLDLDALTE